ncbi:D-mannose binding lectin protein with Apple-likecarbohydrate-binding domain, partial [Striga asiatica]
SFEHCLLFPASTETDLDPQCPQKRAVSCHSSTTASSPMALASVQSVATMRVLSSTKQNLRAPNSPTNPPASETSTPQYLLHSHRLSQPRRHVGPSSSRPASGLPFLKGKTLKSGETGPLLGLDSRDRRVWRADCGERASVGLGVLDLDGLPAKAWKLRLIFLVPKESDLQRKLVMVDEEKEGMLTVLWLLALAFIRHERSSAELWR